MRKVVLYQLLSLDRVAEEPGDWMFAAERIHQRVVIRVLDQPVVDAYIPAYKGRRGLRCATNECGKFLVGAILMHHGHNLLI
jgi:hypothetical protein